MAKQPPSPSGSTLPEGSYFLAAWGVWQAGNVKVYDEVSSRLLRDVVSGTAGIAWVSWTRGRLLGMRGLLPQPHEPFCKPVVDFQQVQPVGMGEVGKRFCERMQTVEVETVYTVYRRMFVWTSWSYSSGKVALGVVAGRALVDKEGLLECQGVWRATGLAVLPALLQLLEPMCKRIFARSYRVSVCVIVCVSI